jgi:hypothetical protein
LRREVDPAELWSALKAALQSENQTAKVSAARVLLQELYEPTKEKEPQHQAEIAAASRKLDQLIETYVYEAVRESDAGVTRDPKQHSHTTRVIARAVERAREGREDELEGEVGRILTSVANGLKLQDATSSERAEAILQGLEETGLLVPRGKVEELIAQRTASLERERDEALARLKEFASA